MLPTSPVGFIYGLFPIRYVLFLYPPFVLDRVYYCKVSSSKYHFMQLSGEKITLDFLLKQWYILGYDEIEGGGKRIWKH